jgi:hypothetical protein
MTEAGEAVTGFRDERQTWPRLTLLGKSRRSISSAMGVRITRGINGAGFFKRHVFALEGR